VKTKLLTVGRREDGAPLVEFLARRLHISRKKAKALLDARSVFVNRRRTWMARHALQHGDGVEIIEPETPPPRKARLEVLYEDDDYAIVNKKAGTLSNGPGSVEAHCRAEWRIQSLSAVHRLDRDTSGCLLLGKNSRAVEKAIALFRSHKVAKSYHAIAAGKLDRKKMTLNTPIQGRRAVTHVNCLDAGKEASHLQVKTETGRTHQVRKHLASTGHPVLGDRHYFPKVPQTSKSMKIGRQMLHASQLAFESPVTGRKIVAKAPLPHDFRACLKKYGLT